MAARGMFHSGAMEKWKHEVNADKAKIGELFKIAPNAQSTYDTLEAGQLESELVAVHRLRGEIKGLLDKYSEVICSDDERPMSLAVRHKCRRPL